MGGTIVVMGGSFNPPTIAHLKVLQAAMDEVDAEKGYLVPVSYPYLKRKMVKAGTSHLCISDEARLEMLRAMCARDDRIHIYTEEMAKTFTVTYVTMGDIQERNQEANLFFLIGADKIGLIEEFCKKSDFLDRFGVVVCARAGERPEAEVEKYENLRLHRSSMVFIQQPSGIETVSSTAIREHLFDIDAVADMLLPETLPTLRKLREENFPEEIIQFSGEYAFLDNSFLTDVEYEGIIYPSAESAFQASKVSDHAGRKPFALYKQDKMRQKGACLTPYNGWEEKKLEIMRQIVKGKFVRHSDLREKLLKTRGLYLIAGSKKKETYWGVNLTTWEGENHLGQILMEIRSELQEEKL